METNPNALREKILADIKSAMLAKETVKLNTLRFLQAAIKNKEIDARPNPINADDVLSVIKKLAKQRKESIEQFTAANRMDLADQESAELKFLEVYLPTQMDQAQVEKIITDVISTLGAKSMKDMGSVVKEVMARTAGSADGKMLSEIVKAKLSQQN